MSDFSLSPLFVFSLELSEFLELCLSYVSGLSGLHLAAEFEVESEGIFVEKGAWVTWPTTSGRELYVLDELAQKLRYLGACD